jgi:hypothetical protein
VRYDDAEEHRGNDRDERQENDDEDVDETHSDPVRVRLRRMPPPAGQHLDEERQQL